MKDKGVLIGIIIALIYIIIIAGVIIHAMDKRIEGGSKMKLEDILKETAEVKKFRSIQDEMMESVLKEK